MDLLGDIEKKMEEWKKEYDSIISIIHECNTKLREIDRIRNNLTKLVGKQTDDDLKYYFSIINNSYTYFSKSLIIRQKKALKDFSEIMKKLDNNKDFTELDKTNFDSLCSVITKIHTNLKLAHENNTKLKWVKDDRIESLNMTISILDETLEYHQKIMVHFCNLLDLEEDFYCSDKT